MVDESAQLLQLLQTLQSLVEAQLIATARLKEENATLRQQVKDTRGGSLNAYETFAKLPGSVTSIEMLEHDHRTKLRSSKSCSTLGIDSHTKAWVDHDLPAWESQEKYRPDRSQTMVDVKRFLHGLPTMESHPVGSQPLARWAFHTERPLTRTVSYELTSLPTGGRVFADEDTIKEHLEKNLLENKISNDPYACYSDVTFWGRLARSQQFEIISVGFVIGSSLWVAVDLDANHEPMLHKSHWVFQLAAHTFCAFFVGELFVRLLAFQEKIRIITDLAFMFDFLLVLLMVVETWVITLVIIMSGSDVDTGMQAFVVLRTLRLSRALRLARVLRQLPELLIIVRGIGVAFKAITVVIGLIFFIIYVSAIVFCVLTEGMEIRKDRFDTVLVSMSTLLLDCTLAGSKGTHIMKLALSESFPMAVLLFAFVLIANITMMGVMTGLLVHTVRTTADVEKEAAQLHYINDTVDEMWGELQDMDGDGLMSEAELFDSLRDKRFASALQAMGVDVLAFLDVSDYVFQQHGEKRKLSRTAFKKVVLNLRGKTQAKVKDHVETRMYIHAWLKEKHGENKKE